MYNKTTNMKRLIPYMGYLKGYLILAVLCAVASFFSAVLIPLLVVQMAFNALTGEIVSYGLLSIIIVLAILCGLFKLGERYFSQYIASKVLTDFRRIVFSQLRRLAPAKLVVQHRGMLLTMMTEDIAALEILFAKMIPPIMTAIIVTVCLSVYFGSIHLLLLIAVWCIYGSLALGVPAMFSSMLHPVVLAQHFARKQYMANLLESLKGMHELKQFNQADRFFKQLQAQRDELNAKEHDVVKFQSLQQSVTNMIVGVGFIVVFAILLLLVQKGLVRVSIAVGASVVLASSFAPYIALSRLPLGFKRAMNAADTLFELLDEPDPIDKIAGHNSTTIDSIEMKSVSFRYDATGQTVLDNAMLNVKATQPQQIIGIMGGSGSGKSTLMKLLMKWYVANKGDIVLSDHNILQLSARSIQSKMAYIPQMPQLFSQTIRENLVLANYTISDDQIEAVCRQCQIWDRIQALPDGLNTQLIAEQTPFSSGELQRLELCRALLKGASCYIFDEPTSYLDALNEASLLNVIKEHCQGLVLIISHRESTMAIADVVYELKAGKLTQIK